MNPVPGQAILQAIALQRAPRGQRPRASDPLPEGMTQLIRVAAGEEGTLRLAQEQSGEPGDALVAAARFYVQQVLFAPQSDSFRVLGVDARASDDVVREHYRWLVKWLHPDRNPDQWEAFYADRVNRAWRDLRSPARRARYLQELSEAGGGEDAWPVEAGAIVPLRPGYAPDEAPGRPVNLRWVPKALMLSLGIVAIVLVGVFSVLQFAPPARKEAVAAGVPEEYQEAPLELAAPAVGATSQPPGEKDLQAASDPAAVVPPPAAADVPQDLAAVAGNPAPSAPAPVPDSLRSSKPLASLPPAPDVGVPVKREVPVRDASAATAHVLAPTPGSPPAPLEAISGPRFEPAIANRMLGDFSQAYGDGDIDGMRQLFTEDVRSNRGGLSEILADYRSLFGSSDRRTLNVHDVSWFADGDSLVVIASYSATVSDARDGRPRKSHGDLRFDLRKVNDQWRIYRFQHGVRPG